LKDTPYHVGGFGIYQKMIFVFWVFDVSIRRIGTEKRPALGSGPFCAFDPAGEVTAVQVVDQAVLNGDGVSSPKNYKVEAGCTRTPWRSIQEENFWFPPSSQSRYSAVS